METQGRISISKQVYDIVTMLHMFVGASCAILIPVNFYLVLFISPWWTLMLIPEVVFIILCAKLEDYFLNL